MEITISSCNNIDQGVVSIVEDALNIKYAINGTGKSTLAKAISAAAAANLGDASRLKELIPFKHLKDGSILPSLTGIESLSSIKVFDEAYINSFVFQQDDLLKGSFDIFIKSPKYDDGIVEIEGLMKALKDNFGSDPEIESLLQDFDEISGSFGKPTKSGLHGSSALGKSFKDGNKVQNVPAGLEAYSQYIQHQNGYKWIKWQQDGAAFADIGADCPYCVGDIKEKKETIERVSTTYDSKSIESLNKIVATFERLNKYFSDSTRTNIEDFCRNVEKYSKEQIDVLNAVKDQIDSLAANFRRCKSLGFSSLKDVGKVIEELAGYKINLALFNHLQSEETAKKVKIVNDGLDSLLGKAGLLQGAVARQRKIVEDSVKGYSARINEFLANAGYNYKVVLSEGAEAKHRLQLVHNDLDRSVGNVRNHLSFGERNAIALVLFMFDAVKSAPTLIVLDDPISSFDKNKKYAIIEMLFKKELSLRGKTTLLLTHDLDPVVDMLLHHSDRFAPPIVSYLENVNGVLSERPILRSNIKTYFDVNSENIASPIPVLNRLVYLRRLLEIKGEKGDAFDVVSNVFHKRELPIKFEGGVWRDMNELEISAGCTEIKGHIPEFDYSSVLSLVNSKVNMKQLYAASTSNYEKLHLYRIIFDDQASGVQSQVVLKFINEAFHIENNYIYQLNPREYQSIPHFVIQECDKYVAALT